MGQRGQILLLLIFITIFLQAVTNQAVIYAHTYAYARIHLADLFHCQNITHRIQAAAAVFRFNHHTHKAKIGQLFDLFFWKPLEFVPLNYTGQAFIYGKIPCCLLYHQLLF